MKRHNIKFLALLGCCCLLGCASSKFALFDPDTGMIIGPFSDQRGAVLSIGEKQYVVVLPEPGSEETQARLRNTIVPEMCFFMADVRDAIDVLRQAQREYEPSDGKRLNPIDILLFVPDKWQPEDMGKVIYAARDMSIYDALDIIARRYGLAMVIKERAVWLVHKDWKATRTADPPSSTDAH